MFHLHSPQMRLRIYSLERGSVRQLVDLIGKGLLDHGGRRWACWQAPIQRHDWRREVGRQPPISTPYIAKKGRVISSYSVDMGSQILAETWLWIQSASSEFGRTWRRFAETMEVDQNRRKEIGEEEVQVASKRLSWLQMLLSGGLDHPRDGGTVVLEAAIETIVAARVGNEGVGAMGKDSWMGIPRLAANI